MKLKNILLTSLTPVFLAGFIHTNFAQVPSPGELVQKELKENDSTVPEPTKNRAPQISEAQVIPGGVAPKEGLSGDTFRFGFDYRDVDNDPCVRCEVWIDENLNGTFEDSEKHPLSFEKVHSKRSSAYSQSEKYSLYIGEVTIRNQSPETQIPFRFYAFDGDKEATLWNTYVNAKNNHVQVVAQFVPMPSSSKPKSVTGGKIVLEASVLVQYQLKKDVFLDWETFLKENNFGPLTIIDYSVDDAFFNEAYDKITARIFASVAQDAENKEYTFSSHRLPFEIFSEEQTGEIAMKDQSYVVSPYIISGPFTRSVASVGEPFDYTFSVLVGAGYDPSDIVDFSIDQITMKPFDVYDAREERVETPSGVQRITYHLRLAMLAEPKEYKLPPLKTGMIDFPPQRFTVLTLDTSAKIPENINDLVKIVKGMKKDATHHISSASVLAEDNGHRFIITSVVIIGLVLSVFCVAGVRRVTKMTRQSSETQKVNAYRENYQKASELFEREKSHENLISCYHALRAYIFVLFGENDIVGYSAQDIKDRKGKMSEYKEIPEDLIDNLVKLEDLYFPTSREGIA